MKDPVRRKILFGLASLPVSGLAALPTPRGAEGPFYPTPAMRYADVDNDLVRIGEAVKQAGGEIVRLGGRVVDFDGRPIESARVEIWQCDARGRYLHRGDSGGARDPGFQGFGYDLTDSDGRYSFRTIKPVPYTGRTPHIHVKVLVRNRERLTTQFYLPDHPHNARDWLYQRIPADQRERVTMHFSADGDEPRASVDLVVPV